MTFLGGIDPMGISNSTPKTKGDFGMSKKLKIISILFIIAVAALFITYVVADPANSDIKEETGDRIQTALNQMKQNYEERYGVIRNPYDTRFDPEQFEFEYYMMHSCMLQEVLAKLFPPGTDKSFVDHVLVNRGGARSEKSANHKNKFIYSYNLKPGTLTIIETNIVIPIQYDNNNQVSSIEAKGKNVYEYPQLCNGEKLNKLLWRKNYEQNLHRD